MRHLAAKGFGLIIGLVLCFGMVFSGAWLPRAVAWDGLTYDYSDPADNDVDGLDLYLFIQTFSSGDTEALAGFAEGFGSDPITVGRALLPCSAVDANQCFGEAVAASTDPDPVLRAFHSVTRIVALIENTEFNTLLTNLGITQGVRSLCGWTADWAYDEITGDPILPAELPSTGTALDTLIGALLPEVQGALDELAGIDATVAEPFIVLCEELVLPDEADSCEKIEVDYGDIALYRAFLQGLKAFLLILDAYNLDIAQTTQLISALEADNFISINDYLSGNTGFLILDTDGAGQLKDAKDALYDAIESYKEASGFIQAETDDQDNDLIQFPEEQEDIDNEAEFMAVLLKIQAALSGITVIDSDEGISLDLTQFFDSAPDLRDFLPTFTDFNEINCGTINPTLGGILTGFSHDDWAEILDIPVPVSGTVSLAAGIGDSDGGSIIVQAYNCWEGDPSGLADLQWCPEKGSVSLSSAGDYTIWLRTEYDAVWMIAFWDNDGDSELSPGDYYGVHGDQSFDITSTNCSGPIGINITVSEEVLGIEGVATTGEGDLATAVTDIRISVYDSVSGDYITSIETDSDGSFSLVGMSSSDSVYFYISQSTEQNTIGGWWNGSGVSSLKSEAVPYTPGNGNVSIAISLVQAGSISGTVSTPDGPLKGIWVCAHGGDDSSWNYAQTGSDGSYTISGLWAGSYFVYASGYGTDYATEYYDNTDYLSATSVDVTLGNTRSGIDFFLEEGATITGTVTRDSDGAVVKNVSMEAYNAENGVYVACTNTDSYGVYTFSGLCSGTYVIRAFSYDDLLGEYYGGEQDFAEATTVSVDAGDTRSGVDFSLKAFGSISGTVFDANEAPVEGIWVYAYGYTEGDWRGEAQTGSDGKYTITGLSVGTYRVEANTYGTKYIAQYYDNAEEYSSASQVEVASGTDTPAIDFTLQTSGYISGSVTNAGSDPIEGVYIEAYNDDGTIWESVNTGSGGNYLISGLQTGTYTVRVYASEMGYVSQEHGDVAVVFGEETTLNLTLEKGASISGKVINTDNDPIEGVWVEAYNNSTGTSEGAVTDSEGDYIVQGLLAGTYQVTAYTFEVDYVDKVYDSAQTVTSGQAVSEINFTLEAYGAISGTVSGGGSAVEALIEAYTDYGLNVSSVYTNSDGNYTIPSLPAGTYKIKASPISGDFQSEYYDGIANYGEATPVAVNAGETTENIHFTLEAISAD